MKRFLCLCSIVLIAASGAARAGDGKVEAAMAVDRNSQASDTFTADIPKLYAFFRSDGAKKGDVLRDNFFGAFSLSKPTAGWPVGKSHVNIYLGATLATSVPATVAAAITGAKPGAGAREDDSSKSSDPR